MRVQESPVETETTFASVARRPGQSLIAQTGKKRTVSVFFKIRELYSLSTRMDIIALVNRWAAGGGDLAVSYRPEQTLPVALIQAAHPNDIKAYSEETEIVFESTFSPYWEDGNAIRHQMTGASGASQLAVSGDICSFVNAAVYVLEYTSILTITVGETSVRLQNLFLPPGAYVTFTHDRAGLISILYGDMSLYPFLTDDSGDMLMSKGGVTDISFETDGDIEITFSSQGRWT